MFSAPSRTIELLLVASVLLGGVGCNTLPNSGIDPSGERLFSNSPLQTLNPANCELFNRRNRSTSTPSTTIATPIPVPTDNYQSLPGNLGAAQPGSSASPYGSTATAMSPGGRGINTALIASPDTGPKPVFADTGGYALPTEPITGPAIVMTPREQIAPVGSEVVLISSYLGNKDRLMTNEKIEWSMEGAGTILKFDEGSYCDPLHYDFVKAKKVSERFAITKTSQLFQNLDRGTANTKDDIHLLKGQTWISVNSMREGTSTVTAFAPSMKDWSKRTDFGVIHWVDAQWVLPTLPIAPVGDQRILTMVVLRQTNGQPRAGWIVRYELLNGPLGGFGPSRAQIEEVATDINGRATITLSQTAPVAGTNTIAVRIIRPAGIDGSDRRVTVGNETIRQTWAGNPDVIVRMEGPPNSKINQDIPYTITASNDNPATANGVVSLTIPPTATFVRAVPQPIVQPLGQGTLLQWNTSIPPNGASTISLVLRRTTAGTLSLNYPVFHPQAVAVQPAAPATTFVPPTTVPSTPTVSPLPSVPTPPPSNMGSIGPGAKTFAGSGTAPTGTGAAVFPAKVRSNVQKTGSVRVGSPCRISLTVENIGNAEINNVAFQFKLPPEYSDRSTANLKRILSSGDMQIIDQNYTIQVDTPIPQLLVGQKKDYVVEFPTIPQQGYTLAHSILVNGQVVEQNTTKILPD